LLAAEAGVYSGFGDAVAVSGDTVVIGARFLDTAFPRSGAAFVFEREGEDWVESAKLLPSHPRESLGFGTSVAIDGNTIVVGAPAGFISPAAEVYVFEREGAAGWKESDRIVWSNQGFVLLPFGTHVALSGSTLAVAGDDFGGSTTVHLYERLPGAHNWEPIRGVSTGGFLSNTRPIALSGSTLVASNPYSLPLVPAASTNASIPTHQVAEVFERDRGGANQWGSVTKLWTGEFLIGGPASSVAIDENTIVAGADRFGDTTTEPGAYVYYRDRWGPDVWGVVTKLLNPEARREARFGRSVAVQGSTVAVGAAPEGVGVDPGSVHVFQRDRGGLHSWGHLAKLTAFDPMSGDRFGQALAMHETRLVVGAHGAGAAYVIELGAIYQCKLKLSFSNGGLTVGFGLKAPSPLTWNVWLSSGNRMDRLWSLPIGTIDTELTFDVSAPGIPSVGRIGIVTTLVDQNGIVCKGFEAIDTGEPEIPLDGGLVRELFLSGATATVRR
jgi:hypothetical protein